MVLALCMMLTSNGITSLAGNIFGAVEDNGAGQPNDEMGGGRSGIK